MEGVEFEDVMSVGRKTRERRERRATHESVKHEPKSVKWKK